MERRLFVFMVLSLLIWGGFMGLNIWLAPPQPLVDVAKEDAAKKQAEKKIEAKKGEKPPEAQTDAEKKSTDLKATDEPSVAKVGAKPVAVSTAPRKHLALGSLDATSGHTMLVTFDSRGAGIERVELNGAHFHDLDDLSGYMGHLALEDAKGGCKVNVVGPGTPAATATSDKAPSGLQPDDLIVKVDDVPADDVETLERYFQGKTKPGQTVQVTVERSAGETKKTIVYAVSLIRRPLELIRPEVNAGSKPVDPRWESHPFGPPSYRLGLRQLGQTKAKPRDEEIASLPSLLEANWEAKIDSATQTIEFQTTLDEKALDAIDAKNPLRITKRFKLEKSEEKVSPELMNYHLRMEIEIENLGSTSEAVAYRLEGPNGLPLEGWWYSTKMHPGWSGAGARDVAWYPEGYDHQLVGNPALVAHAAKQIKAGNSPGYDLFMGGKENRDLRYLAVDTQFFASALLPADALQEWRDGKAPTFHVADAEALPLNEIQDKKRSKIANVSFHLTTRATTIEPGQKHTGSYLVFAGPKSTDTLERYGLVRLIEYGWFGWVSKVLLKVLSGLYYVTGNYGISIILLTVIVRSGLLPFSIRQAKSAALMQQLAPEMAKIKEKYATDMEKQSMAMRELYAKYNFNPFGGCLLMFAQLPIFIGLYRCLSVDIELREAALIPGWAWCSNLAGPDELFRWKHLVWDVISDEAHGWLGPYFNVLPLITILLFIIQQKLFTPPPTDEQSEMQQKMMTFMTVFMGVMFYKVPAGLCIYFITSSLWGIIERKLMPKQVPPAVTTAPGEKKEVKESPLVKWLTNIGEKETTTSTIRRKPRKK